MKNRRHFSDGYDEQEDGDGRNSHSRRPAHAANPVAAGKILSLRIGSGSMSGRKILPPPGNETRPMTGFAKKSLFSILMQQLDGAVVLDLYSGTGTLGLESHSNGAAKVYFAEQSRRVVERLKENIAALGVADRSEVWEGNIDLRLADWLMKLRQPFDVAFVDPPYASARTWDWAVAESRIFAPLAGKIADDGVVVLRVPGNVELPEKLGGLAIKRMKEYGDMKVGFYGRAETV